MLGGQQKRGFVTGGTWCLDRNRTIDRWPHEDSGAFARTIDERGGGSACNLAIDMRCLDSGMPVETIGLVGDDAAGRRLIEQADAAGLNRDQLRICPDAPTNVVEAFISEASGLRTHVTEL